MVYLLVQDKNTKGCADSFVSKAYTLLLVALQTRDFLFCVLKSFVPCDEQFREVIHLLNAITEYRRRL